MARFESDAEQLRLSSPRWFCRSLALWTVVERAITAYATDIQDENREPFEASAAPAAAAGCQSNAIEMAAFQAA